MMASMMVRRRFRVVVLAFTAACSGNGSYKGDASPDDGGNASDAAVADAPATPDGGGPAFTGYVSAFSSSYVINSQPIASGSLSAGFTADGGASTCVATQVAPCQIYKCTSGQDAGAQQFPSAGDVSLSGGTTPVTISPTANGTYTSKSATTTLWNGGETLTMQATGAQVPAFNGTLTAPFKVTLSTPTMSGQSITVNRSTPFVLTWTGAGSSTVIVSFSTTNTIVSCQFDGTAGNGSVPSSALQNLPAGSGGFGIYSSAMSHVTAGNWDVTLEGFSLGVTPNGGPTSATLTLQ
jgi:hypothetical protein